ncbi:cytosolic sulfotransferase 15-like [Mercurialis annua]|uniref:cytosolic sulfotransferase 15-like n=1 Tax=Mercurialis annua TaxID=3986 RepID=UPI002160ED01|nr:cytosolic sulfotransferase 15-like [Mercurialis annua]
MADEEEEELISSLPKASGLLSLTELCLYQNFWCSTKFIPNIISFQKHFQAQDQDIIVASVPKCGTTWLKALTFSIVNRTRYDSSTTPLLSSNPHHLVPILEYEVFAKKNGVPDLTTLPSPRLFSTHMPYSALPESIKHSGARVVYICRNPFDAAVSLCHHLAEIKSSEAQNSIEESFEMYFKGVAPFGPFWDHVLGYWKESLEKKKKVLFLKYEDLKDDIAGELKRIAEFVGCPFSEEEERRGVVQEIAKLCSLTSLKELEVNKSGSYLEVYPHTAFFRKGQVGGWADYLSDPSLKQRLENVMQEKLSGSGLSFKLS